MNEEDLLNVTLPEIVPEPVPETFKSLPELRFETEIASQAIASLQHKNPAPSGSFKTHFEVRSDGSLVWATEPLDKIVTLQVDHFVDLGLVKHADPMSIDKYLKSELARKLADKMIEEDLIKIQYSDDPATYNRTYRATVKFVQE